MIQQSFLGALAFLFLSAALQAQPDEKALQALLEKPIIRPGQTQEETVAFIDPRVARLASPKSAAEWQKTEEALRKKTLDEVVFRGEAANWRKQPLKVEWLENLPGGPGYQVHKLLYEAVPGLMIPAILYEPTNPQGKVPVVMNVNGHDAKGMAADYKQIRCINLVKRGMIVLNPEWIGMGQLRAQGYAHSRMNQLDLCGSSGLAPFFLAMQRGLDLLLALPQADPNRVAVSGLSGGGWQTICISGLDPRVTLANPVAGYSSFRTRLRVLKDLGDSEQTPTDLGAIADYCHLTAMRGGRPTLLTYNATDNCCFESATALPLLEEAARPVFNLLGKPAALRTHVNFLPGNHNYDIDNREAFYRMVGDHFFPNDVGYSGKEIPHQTGEIRSLEDLAVELPVENKDFNLLAKDLAAGLPKNKLPMKREEVEKWQKESREKLTRLTGFKKYEAVADKPVAEDIGGLKIRRLALKLGQDWTLGAVESTPAGAKKTVVIANDEGRAKSAAWMKKKLAEGYRVVAVDPFLFGESKVGYLFALTVATVGERPLGLQASQLAAVCRWAEKQHGAPVELFADGPRITLAALVASALESQGIASLSLARNSGSLKELIEQNQSVDKMPEAFCFALLEHFDLVHLTALTAPRQVKLIAPSDRAKKEFLPMAAWYPLAGGKWEN
ncbi:MAG: hypothetical protein EXR99_06280 [Gemmataceae bacterium]|nr:hypothetical protein [Gemmataceae bacterium]